MVTAESLEQLISRARAFQSLPEPPDRREIRERVGLSQADLARALGVSVPTLSRWESGGRAPRRDHLLEYSELLGRLGALDDEDPGRYSGVSVKTSTTARHGRHGFSE